jgi:DNA (cytosine-5)-methyltransferase 1
MQRTMATKRKKKHVVRPLRVVSLFAGAGGLEIALCNTLPVEAIVSSDSNATFLKTTEINLPNHFPKVKHTAIVSDARALTGKMLTEALGGPCDLVMGGPPCDDFTKYGRRRGLEGDKGPLIFEFSRLVTEIRPRAFLFENVPNILKVARNGFEQVITEIQDAGYICAWKLLKASDFGAPTLRERVFLLGASEVHASPPFPDPTHGSGDKEDLFATGNSLKPLATVCSVLQSLPPVEARDTCKILNHTPRKHREATIHGFTSIAQGGFERGSYRYRAPWDGLCWSLTAGLDDSTKAHLHPLLHREMTVREYARIHGFPDSWHFQGTNENGTKQVANSVPVPLGEAVLMSLSSCFTHK